MILNKMNDEFNYHGIIYKVGAPIVGTDASEYEGLFGRIIEIRTDDDKQTENTTPDIYCSFDIPVLQQEINDVEARFSELYGAKKWIDDIIFDEVILAPEMIKPLPDSKQSADDLELFVVTQEWSVDGEYDNSTDVFADYDEAKHLMHETLKEDMENGTISRIGDDDKFVSEEADNFYEGYIDGERNENFYGVEIKRIKINISDRKLLALIAQRALSSQIKDWDETAKLNKREQNHLIYDSDAVSELVTEFYSDEIFMEQFWKVVSEIGFKYVDEYAGDRPGCFVPEQNIEKPMCLGNEDNEDCVNCDFYCNRREYLNGNPTLYALLKSYFGKYLDAETIDKLVWEVKLTHFHNDNEAERRAYANMKAWGVFTSIIAKMREMCKTSDSTVEYFKGYKTDISLETAEKILNVLNSSDFDDITEE